MARGRKKTVLEVELPDDGEGEAQTEMQGVEAEEAESIVQELRSEQPRHPLEIVHRLDDDTGEEGWVGKFAASAVTPEFLAKRFGPGRYRCYMRKPDGKGHMVFGGSRVVNVVADLRPKIEQGPVPSGDGARGTSLGETMLISMMKQQSESAAQSMQMMQGLFTALTGAFTALKPSAPAVDPVMLEVLRSTINRKDPTEIATALLGVMRESAPGGKDPIEQLKSLLELRELLGGDGQGDPETMMITKGLDTLQQLFAQGRAFQPTTTVAVRPAPAALPAAASAAAPQPVSVPSPETPAVPIDPNLRPWLRGVMQNLPLLLQASVFMPPSAAALTARDQMEAAGVWTDLVADVRSDAGAADVPDPLPASFGEVFVERTLRVLAPGVSGEAATEWVRETLYELAELAVEPEEEAGEGEGER